MLNDPSHIPQIPMEEDIHLAIEENDICSRHLKTQIKKYFK